MVFMFCREALQNRIAMADEVGICALPLMYRL